MVVVKNINMWQQQLYVLYSNFYIIRLSLQQLQQLQQQQQQQQEQKKKRWLTDKSLHPKLGEVNESKWATDFEKRVGSPNAMFSLLLTKSQFEGTFGNKIFCFAP